MINHLEHAATVENEEKMYEVQLKRLLAVDINPLFSSSVGENNNQQHEKSKRKMETFKELEMHRRNLGREKQSFVCIRFTEFTKWFVCVCALDERSRMLIIMMD